MISKLLKTNNYTLSTSICQPFQGYKAKSVYKINGLFIHCAI